MKRNLLGACAVVLVLVATAYTASTKNLKTTAGDLSAEDLAMHLRLRHKTFTLDGRKPGKAIQHRVVLLRKGVEVSTTHWTGYHGSEKDGPERISVIFETEEETVRLTYRQGRDSNWLELRKPADIKLSIGPPESTNLDEQGRVMLAFDVTPQEDGDIMIRAENSTPAGASAALVLQIREVDD